MLVLTFDSTLTNHLRSLIDEGRDVELSWWNLPRHHVVRDNGEMLLVASFSEPASKAPTTTATNPLTSTTIRALTTSPS